MLSRLIRVFVVGGFLGLIGQLFALLSMTVLGSNVSPLFYVMLTVFLFGCLGVLLILTGAYEALLRQSAEGINVLLSGLMFGAAMATADAISRRNATLRAVWQGFYTIIKILGAGFIIALILGVVFASFDSFIAMPSSPSVIMQFLWAFVLAGSICVVSQLLVEAQLPFPAVIVLMISVIGGLCTAIGITDALNSFSLAGVNVTAAGCGNGAYLAGKMLVSAQWLPLIFLVALNVLLVTMGALCGIALAKKNRAATQQR